MSNQVIYYQIADLLVKISLPMQADRKRILPSFEPFRVESTLHSKHTFMEVCLCVDQPRPTTQDNRLLSDISYIMDYSFQFEETASYYITTVLESNKEKPFCMYSSKDFRHNTLYSSVEDIHDNFKTTWLIMVAFGQCILQEKGMLIHASAIMKDNKVQAFLGISGTGKSTHSRLWLEHIVGSTLLNDDNPAIRIKEDGSVWMYGTPWSGKTNCYKAEAYPLQALVRLEQAPKNQIKPLMGAKALMALLPSGSAIRWNNALFQLMVDHASHVASHVKIGYLKCLPNEEAAQLSYRFCFDDDEDIIYA